MAQTRRGDREALKLVLDAYPIPGRGCGGSDEDPVVPWLGDDCI